MVAITYGAARAAASVFTGSKTEKGLLVRIYNALVAARMRAAEREIARHSHLLAHFNKDDVFGHNPKH